MHSHTLFDPAPALRTSRIRPLALGLVAAMGLLLATAMPALAQCPLSIAPASNYPAGTTPYSVAVGDFNADGRSDLAVANQLSDNVSILMGNANGTFHPAMNYAVGSAPFSVAVGDFNADGRPDLAVANFNSNKVSILQGNANGTFQTAINYAVGTSPLSIAVGDFNADGRPDLAVANFTSNTVSILLGNANGTFQVAVNYAAGSRPYSVVVGDFNADGRPDLAVANFSSNTVSILLGNGNGTFQAAVTYAVGSSPVSVAVGDFNANGSPDLAVANFNSANVSILLGNGNGTFQGAVNYTVGGGPRSVAVDDFNADGRPDLAVASGNNGSILLANANGTLQAVVNYAAGSGPFSIAVGDFNADGRPDLAVANANSNNVSVFLNTGSGFPPPAIIQQPVGLVVPAGQNAALSVAANGFGNTLTYQWRKNGVPIVNGGTIAGATSPTLTFTPALLGDFASFDVQVTGAAACNVGAQVTTSALGILGVSDPCLAKQPSITQQPASQIILSGNAAMFTVAATSPAGGGTLTYQWRRNGVDLSNSGAVSGATSATLTINPAALSDNGASFVCIVSNTCGSTSSNSAGLAVATIFCLADVASDGLDTIYNPNGSVGPEDLDAFIAAFINGC